MALWILNLKKYTNASYQKRVIFECVGKETLPSPYIKDCADQGQVVLLVRLWVVLISGLQLRAYKVCFFHHKGFWRSHSAHQRILPLSHSLDTWQMSSEETAACMGLCSSMGGWLMVLLYLQAVSPIPAFQAAQRPRRCPLGKLVMHSKLFTFPSCHSSPVQSIEALLLFVSAEPQPGPFRSSARAQNRQLPPAKYSQP